MPALHCFRIRAGFSRSGAGLFGGYHRHAGNPTWNGFVELLIHCEVSARREGAEGGNPGQDLVCTATCRLADLVRVESVDPPNLATAKDVHELLVPIGVERFAGSFAR